MKRLASLFAILAAVLYAFSIPLSKLLLIEIPSTLLAGFLYLGAGIGVSLVSLFKKVTSKKESVQEKITKKDLKYIFGMIVLDIIAPIMLLLSISSSPSSSISLINNFEIVATSFIALLIFKEKIGKNLWGGIILITLSSILLSFDFKEGITFSFGSIFAFIACLCWGLENNCTRSLSNKNPYHIVIIKGIFSGLGSLIIGIILNEKIGDYIYAIYALSLGFVSYGLSILFYVMAQRYLGAAKTSAFYAINPFIGSLLSFVLLKEAINYSFFIALTFMICGVFFVNRENFILGKKE